MRENGKPPEPSSDRTPRQPPRSGDEYRRERRLPIPPRSANPLARRSQRPAPPPTAQSPRDIVPLGRPTVREKPPRQTGFGFSFFKRLGTRQATAKKEERRSPLPGQFPKVSPLRPGTADLRAAVPSPRLQVAPPPDRPLRQRRERSFSAAAIPDLSGPRPQTTRPLRPRTKSGTALVYGTRLLILGVGVGVIAGTILSIWDPASRLMAGAEGGKPEPPAATKVSVPAGPDFRLDQEISGLKSDVQALVTQQAGLKAGLLFVDLDTNSYLDLNATQSFSAASTIKFPVLVAFFQDVDAGKIQLDEILIMRKDLVASESGEMQYQPVGSKFSALETANKMITVSDNTATNMLIDRLGGRTALDQRFQSWGLTATQIRNPLPDLEGTNTTSAKDLVTLMGMVNEGKLLSLRSRDRLFDIMRRTANRSLLPKGLGEGATIAHKTGDIGSLVGDIGMIDTPNGRRYLAAVLVNRPFNDDRAQELIRQISHTTYKYFSQPDFTQARKGQQQGDPKTPIDPGNEKVAQP
jgi:beta-lactamase class A